MRFARASEKRRKREADARIHVAATPASPLAVDAGRTRRRRRRSYRESRRSNPFTRGTMSFAVPVLLVCATTCAFARASFAVDSTASLEHQYVKDVKPLLIQYCGDCHFDGVDKGDLSL